MKWGLTISLFFIHILTHGQIVISGVVKDEVSRQPVSYATVGIENSSTGVYSDSLGAFKLYISEEKKRQRITISAIGYEIRRVLIKDASGEIFLSPVKNILEEVIVSANMKTLGELNSRWWLSAMIYSTTRENAIASLPDNIYSPVFLTTASYTPLDTSFINNINQLNRVIAIGRVFKWQNRHAAIRKIAFKIYPWGMQHIKFQLNVLDAKSLNPILNKRIYFDWRPGTDTLVSISLANENLKVKSDFIVAIEAVEAIINVAESPNNLSMFSMHGAVGEPQEYIVYKTEALNGWKKIEGFIPAIQVTIQH